MSMRYLGETLDIHCGGIDHIPVHNTNEIAQSECATGHTFARFWIHGAFLNIKGSTGPGHAKMAKSGDNFITMERLLDRGFDPLAYRYFSFNAHYRSELTFSWDALDGARRALARIYRLSLAPEPNTKEELEEASAKIEAALLDDLNAPKALAILHETRSFALWKKFDPILGLEVVRNAERLVVRPNVPTEVLRLAAERNDARLAKDWATADSLRRQIEQAGFVVSDDPSSSRLTPA